jgi:hypothetical protein
MSFYAFNGETGVAQEEAENKLWDSFDDPAVEGESVEVRLQTRQLK